MLPQRRGGGIEALRIPQMLMSYIYLYVYVVNSKILYLITAQSFIWTVDIQTGLSYIPHAHQVRLEGRQFRDMPMF